MEMIKALLPILAVGMYQFLLATLWYSPYMFASLWMAHHTPHKDDHGSRAVRPYMFLCAFVLDCMKAAALYVLVVMIKPYTLHEHMHVVMPSIIFVLTTCYSSVLWEKKHHTMFFIHAGYAVVAFLGSGVILFLMK